MRWNTKWWNEAELTTGLLSTSRRRSQKVLLLSWILSWVGSKSQMGPTSGMVGTGCRFQSWTCYSNLHGTTYYSNLHGTTWSSWKGSENCLQRCIEQTKDKELELLIVILPDNNGSFYAQYFILSSWLGWVHWIWHINYLLLQICQ